MRRYDGRHHFAPEEDVAEDAPLPVVALEVTCGRARQRIRPVRSRAWLIGAADDSDLVLGDPQFPDSYAYLMVTPLGVSVRWLGMGPQLAVNEQPAHRAVPLHDGDLLRFGPYELRAHITWKVAADCPPSRRARTTRPRPRSDLGPRQGGPPTVAEIDPRPHLIRIPISTGQPSRNRLAAGEATPADPSPALPAPSGSPASSAVREDQ